MKLLLQRQMCFIDVERNYAKNLTDIHQYLVPPVNSGDGGTVTPLAPKIDVFLGKPDCYAMWYSVKHTPFH